MVKTVDTPSRTALIDVLKPVLGAKQFGHEDLLAPLVADASISVLGKGKVMKVANVRVAKLIGATLQDSSVVQGVVITRNSLGSVKRVQNAKIAVYAQAVEVWTFALRLILLFAPPICHRGVLISRVRCPGIQHRSQRQRAHQVG